MGPEIKERAAAARFDERLSLLGLLLDSTSEELQKVCEQEDVLTALMDSIRKVRVRSGAGQDFGEALGKVAEERQKALNAGCQSSSMSREDQRTNQQVIAVLEDLRAEAVQEYPGDAEKAFAEIKKSFDQRVKALKRSTTAAGKTLKNLFAFCDEVFPDGQEILILVTELTINPHLRPLFEPLREPGIFCPQQGASFLRTAAGNHTASGDSGLEFGGISRRERGIMLEGFVVEKRVLKNTRDRAARL